MRGLPGLYQMDNTEDVNREDIPEDGILGTIALAVLLALFVIVLCAAGVR